MCNLKDKSRFVAFIIKMSVGFKGRQLNVQKPKMKATLIMPNNAVFIFLASSPPPAPSALLRHRLHFKSSKQFWEAELLSEQRNYTELGWKNKKK